MTIHAREKLVLALCGVTAWSACGGDDHHASGKQDASTTDAAIAADASYGDGTGRSGEAGVLRTSDSGLPIETAGDGGVVQATAANCTGTGAEKAVCAANLFLNVLPSATKTAVNLAYSDYASRTMWSNLPGVTRAGVKLSALDEASKTAALSMMATVLSADGTTDLVGVANADDYLGNYSGGSTGGTGQIGGTGPMGGMGDGGPPSGGMGGPTDGGGAGAGAGGGSAYSSGNYTVAIYGTPSTTGNWALSFGGHHMAFNITWHAGVGYSTPYHLGVEPKAQFTINGVSFAPLVPEGEAFFALFDGLTSDQLSAAFLGQSFSDVVLGPVEYMTGSTAAVKSKYPTGTNRTGVLVSSLNDTQKALVIAAIKQWVNDFDASIADQLLADYTTDAAFQNTYVAWGGTQSSGPQPDINGTYLRIDGPRLWLELACQGGVVIQNLSHFHTIYRDKMYDYAADF